MNSVALFLLAFVAAGVSAANLVDSVKSCGDDVPLPTEIYVDGCEQSPCEVKNGDVVNFELVFSPPRDSKALKATTSIMLGPLEIPFELSEKDRDGCSGLQGSECPVVAGQEIRYRLGMAVDALVTGISVDIRFALWDDSGAEAVCYQYSQKITA